jgi:hypothetical protein
MRCSTRNINRVLNYFSAIHFVQLFTVVHTGDNTGASKKKMRSPVILILSPFARAESIFLIIRGFRNGFFRLHCGLSSFAAKKEYIPVSGLPAFKSLQTGHDPMP